MARAMMMDILTGIVVTTMFVNLALAVDHNVGAPNGGWDTSTDLRTWASSQSFTVGDNMVFSYTPNHDVLEVTKADYDSCTIGNPITTNTVSPTTISLTAAGSRYFVCGTPGHCDQGMKVEIKTVAAAASGPPTATPPASTTPPTTTTPPSSSSDTPAPPVSAPGTPTHGGETAKPSPSSAETVKTMTAVSMVGIGFLIMMT